ncbi:hypothetical protein [Amycolatopsis albispora]|uniref:Uncharacterized protein n=1 Tax=Amycolatopsis albispora TaxID=1804986 RepID=A0A344LFG5_9PSEU|nr:hypothetical protein [Amycolatopsis albispora]AXB46789.1 hypothetical protein A4R43_33700 [Amycolatopsis albispora]
MDHSHIGATGSAGADTAALLLRLVLLLGTAFVAGTGLLRPLADRIPLRVTVFTWALAAVSAVLAAVSVPVLDVDVVGAAVHVVLVLAVPSALGRPGPARWLSAALVLLLVVETAVGRSGVEFAVDTVYVAAAAAWFGVTVLSVAVPADQLRTDSLRPGPLSLTLGGLLVLAGAVRLATSGIGFDRRVHESAFGIALLVVVSLPLLVTVVAAFRPSRAYRYGTAGIVAGFVAFSALAAIPRPAELPVPGIPVLGAAALGGQQVPVLISPHRPGRNLVHFPASAGDQLDVGVPGGPLVRATPRAGAEGTWAEIDLPTGRGEVLLRAGDAENSVDVDAGDQPGPALASGADGPECASAALGGLITGRRDVLGSCPADALSTEDADALRKLVTFLDSRGAGGITLKADDSPRGVAAGVVREAAAAAGLRIDDDRQPENALVAVSGWAEAHRALSTAGAQQAESPTYAHGLYLAPWLLNTPLATSVTTTSVPLRFDPREQLPVSYAVAVGNAFGGESPTMAGFHAWLGTQAESVKGEVQIFAAAQVTVMPMGPGEAHAPGMPMTEELAGQWVPKATVVPVSLPLLT